MNYNKKLLFLSSIAMLTSIASCGGQKNSVVDNNSNVTSVPVDASITQSEAEVDVAAKRTFHVPAEGFDVNKETKIVFYHTMNKNLQQVLEAYITDFNEIYPNIIVEHHPIGGYDDVKDQNTQAISTGKNDCDLAYCYPDHIASYNKANSVYILDELIDSNVEITRRDGSKEKVGFTQAQKDDFVEAYWNEGKSLGDGYMYALPLTKSSEVMYYNKTFFEEHNLNVPTTWQEMFNVCKQIKAIDALSIPLGYDSSSNLFITLCEQNNTGYTSEDPNNHYLFDNETNRSIVQDFKNMYDLGYITTKGLYGTYTSGLFTETGIGQKSYMSIGSSAGATNQVPANNTIDGSKPFEVGIARIPQEDPNNGKVISQGPDICLFNNGDNQKALAAWLFTKFLTTNVEFQAQFSMTSGYTPVIKSVNDNEVYAEWLSQADGYDKLPALSTKTCVDQASWYFTSPAFVGSSEARLEVGELIDAALSGSKTIDGAFKAAMENLSRVK